MIWHIAEVWMLLAVAFLLGCPLGVLLYIALARSPLATAQGMLADSIGDLMDAIKVRLGLGPVWRPEVRRMPSRQARDTSALGDESDIARAFPDDLPAHAPVAEDEAYWREDGGEGTWSDEPYEEPDEFAAADPVGAPIEPAGDAIAMRPAGLAAPRNGIPDNLQRIRGIGQRNEELLNSLGIFHFGQIAAWTPAEVRWVSAYLSFPERIERDDWIGQATILASGGATGVTKAADRRRARRQQIRESRSGT